LAIEIQVKINEVKGQELFMETAAPKFFVSYSWANPDIADRVLEIATQLRENGVDAILDKWDLNTGQDKFYFMEQMVRDPNVKKVGMFCDRTYADKANNREGGAGVEGQIISKEIYDDVEQTKFAAIIMERNENEEAFVPIFCSPRMYIDLSDPEKYQDEFDKLLRWIYDKPAYVKPPLGKKPSFLEGNLLSLGTGARQKRVIDSFTGGKDNSSGSLKDYLSEYFTNLERFRVSLDESRKLDDIIFENIGLFLPHRDEFIKVIETVSRYSSDDESITAIHRFFEDLLYYHNRPEPVLVYNSDTFDNFKFIIYELFLYTLAVFIKNENFNYAAYLLNNPYVLPENYAEYTKETMVDFTALKTELDTFYYHGQKNQSKELSYIGHLLKERNVNSSIKFYYIMQADFVCYFRAKLSNRRWFPTSLVYYITGYCRPFGIFAKAQSKLYFDKLKPIFNIKNKDDLLPLKLAFDNGTISSPSWQGYNVPVFYLINFDKLCSVN
jgi:hypothetical protein